VSLYRQPGRSRSLALAALAAGALLIGGAIGFALGRGSADEPSARDVAAQLRERLRPLAAGLELLPTEYPQSLRGAGEESAAVRGDLARMRAALAAAAPDLRALDPVGAAALAARVDALEAAVRARASAARVERLATVAHAALADLPGGR